MSLKDYIRTFVPSDRQEDALAELKALEAELKTARETNARLNRRCQQAETVNLPKVESKLLAVGLQGDLDAARKVISKAEARAERYKALIADADSYMSMLWWTWVEKSEVPHEHKRKIEDVLNRLRGDS